MYVLDTNAFYYAAEISICTYSVQKLIKFIDDNEVFISSTTLFEFLIKYRNDIETIHKGGEFLWKHGVKIVGNKINPIPNYFTGDIVNITESDLERLCKDILDNKIDVESRFISLLFDMCLISGFYFSAWENGDEPSIYCNKVLCDVCRMYATYNLDIFGAIFAEGYKSDDCENYVRNCFYNLLAFQLEKGIPFIERAKTIENDDDFVSGEWISAENYLIDTEKLKNKMRKKTSTAFLQRLAIDYWKNNNDPELKDHISKIKEIFDKKVKYSALRDYFYDTLVDIMTHGSALWKNDFLDAIILCNVQNIHILITFDNGVIKRMERRKSDYPLYAKSIEIINELEEKNCPKE